jgi:beta-phosphoglucomutase
MDFDGTLVDSLPLARQVYGQFAQTYGFQDSDEEFATLNGPSLEEIVEYLRVRHKLDAQPAALCAYYRALIKDAYETVTPKPGAHAVLAEAARRGVRVALVTSADASIAQRFLARHQWDTCITPVVSGEEVARSKPDPAIYHLALARVDCLPSHTVAIEDSVNGVRAAVAAGVEVTALADGSPHATGSDRLRAAGATRVIASLAEFFDGVPS